MVGDASEFGPASRDTYAGILFWPAIFKKFPVLAMETGFARLHPPPSSLQVSNSAGDPCICPANSGLFEFVLVSASVSADKKGGSRPSVSASKNSVPDSGGGDWFDDCKPRVSKTTLTGRFLRGFPAFRFADFGLCRCPSASAAILGVLSPHPKIPFPPLVARFSQIEGYKCLSLTRALDVVKCQLALA